MMEEQYDTIFIPQVTINVIPKVGQEFQSLEDALDFYNNYARQAGFSTRVSNNKKNKETGEDVWKMITCYKEGKTDERWQNKYKNMVARTGERNRGHTRCGCKAKITVKKAHDVWVVGYFVEQHNHPLSTPRKVHLLKSHRKVSETKKALVKQFSEANIPICQQVRLFEIDAGGPSFTGCLERDIINHQRDIQREISGHDAETLIQYFDSEKEKNESFYVAYETDNSGIFMRCFWADCESRRSYAQFGDTMVFDTTYNTNKYSMMFAPFVGVNHHRQTTIFGCGLLSDEKTESFIWLFRKFVECMSGYDPPGVIITDQDVAISRAILEVFPSTLHRFCLWHILDKFPEKINSAIYQEEYHRLVHTIKESESDEEFENRWMELIKSTELKSNDWLNHLYTIRHRWVPAYVKGFFSAGMSSSQRAESNHSFLKRYVNRKNSLVDFIMRFNRALVHQRHEELVATHIDLNEKPRLVTGFLMENQMACIYTKKIFLRFQKELQQSMVYLCTLFSSTDASSKYMVKRIEFEKEFLRERELTHYISSDLISCSCKLFEFEGYPCRHMLCLMKVQQVMMLPNKYIKQRWTKEAKSTILYEPAQNLVEGQSFTTRREALSRMAMDLVDKCSLTESYSSFLMEELHKLKSEVKDLDIDGNASNRLKESNMHECAQSVQDPQSVKDPHVVRAKGCGKRLKSSKEKAMSQSNRSCSICSRSGHDKRTCPNLQPINRSE